MGIVSRSFCAAALLAAVVSSAFAQDARTTALNPKGTPPPIPLAPMAQRPAELEKRTVYFVDVGYEGGDSLLRAIMDWFSKNVPSATLVFREKAGTYEQEDAKLWAELKAKADGVVLAIGH